MTRLKGFVTAAKRHWADVQSAFFTVEVECNEYSGPLSAEEPRRGSLEALLRGVRNCLLDHSSLVDLVPRFIRQDMNRDLEVWLPQSRLWYANARLLFLCDVQSGRDAQCNALLGCFIRSHASQLSSAAFNFRSFGYGAFRSLGS